MARSLFWLLAILMAADLSQAWLLSWGTMRIDCGVSVWSNWGPTANKVRSRTRQIFRYPQNGGTECPHLIETDADPWATYSVQEKAAFVQTSFISGGGQSPAGRKRRQATIKPRDFIFIIDRSGSIGSSNYALTNNKLSELVGEICGEFGLDNQNNRAAVVTFSTQITEHFDFDFHTTTASLQNAIQNLPYNGGSTCTGLALNHAATMFVPSNGARPDSISEKEVVLLTDGMANCGPDEVAAALNLQNSNSPPIPLFVFAIGNTFDQAEIDAMASTPPSTHLFNFVSFAEFADVVDAVVNIPIPCVPIEIGR